MLLLAFDTATPAITVAVHDGERIVGEAFGEGAMAHGELLAPAIREALAQAGATMADLTDVAVGVGPGPFTGLRVGVVTALTIGSTLGIATHGVCSLDIIAAEVQVEGEFLVATDARRKEVYWARYGADHSRLDGPHVAYPADLAQQHPDLPAYGRGAQLYDGVLRQAGEVRYPRAAALAIAVVAGQAVELPLEPLYLRRPDAQPQVTSPRMIRSATLDDVTPIAAIELACFASGAWSEGLVRTQVEGERQVVLVDDGLRAYGTISVVGEVADLDRIATVPSARGEGLARDVLTVLIDQARDRGAARMLLEVAADNMPAIALYESFGFDTISTRTAYYPDAVDALVMEITIEEWR